MKSRKNNRRTLADAADLAVVRVREAAMRLRFGRGKRTEEPALVRFETMMGPMMVYTVRYGDAEEPVRIMDIGGAYESGTYVEEGREYDPPFAYLRAFDCIYTARRADYGHDGEPAPCARLLMLGGGGFAYPKHVVAHHPESSIDVVELDPMVVAVARRYFFLDRCEAEFDTAETGRLNIIEDDAAAFLRTNTDPFDCILNDLFCGWNSVKTFWEVDGARLMKANLSPGGLYVSNVITALEGPGAQVLHDIAAAYKQVFAHVYVIVVDKSAPEMRDNYLMVASDVPWLLPAAREL